jgi:pumilio family protein 6
VRAPGRAAPRTAHARARFNNSDKGAVTHAIVHRVLWEYLSALADVPDAAERERLRRELFDASADVLAEMVHTRDGSRCVREFLAHGSAKVRPALPWRACGC